MNTRALALGAAPALLLALGLVAPVARLVWAGLSGEVPATGAVGAPVTWLTPWTDADQRWHLLWSMALAALTSLTALLLGTPLAWVLARRRFAGRTWVLRLLMLPFVVPTLVAALGVLALIGPRGLAAPWLGGGWAQGPVPLLYGNLFFNLCLVVRAGVEGFERLPASQWAAARSLGASPWRAFWRLEWPVAAPALLAASCLVALYSFAGFGLALVLGGPHWATAEVQLYTLVAQELRLDAAAVLALWLLAMTGALTLGYVTLARRWVTPQRMQPLAPSAPRGCLQWAGLVATLAVLALVCGAPLAAIGAQAWAARDAWGSLWADPEVVDALRNSLRFSALALGLATLLGVMHALASRRALVWRAAAYLPVLVSPVTVAFGLLLMAPTWAGQAGVLIGAYTLLAYPFVTQALTTGLDALPSSALQAAATLGASPWRVTWRVTLPLLAPALRRGMAFALATALGEFAVSLFLSRPEWTTLTTLIYQRLAHPGAANLDAVWLLTALLMSLTLVAFVLIEGDVSERAGHA